MRCTYTRRGDVHVRPFEQFTTSERRILAGAAAIAVALGYTLQVWAFTFLISVSNKDGVNAALSDLRIYRQGGQAILNGLPLYTERLFTDGGGGLLSWTYTPFGALVMVPLTVLPDPVMNTLSVTATLAALTGLVILSFHALLTRLRRPVLAVTLLTLAAIPVTPIADGLSLGQIGVLLTLACLADAVWLANKQSRFTGILVGVATAIKLTPAVFIAYWVVTRQWRAALTAVGTTLTCWTVAAAVTWTNTWEYFGNGRVLNVGESVGAWATTRFNQSWRGTVDRLADGNDPAWLLLVAVTVVVGFWIAARCYKNGNLLAAATVVGFVSVLCSPVSWHHHAVWIVPALAVILGDGTSRWRTLTALVLMIVSYYPARGFQIPGTSEQWVVLYIVLTAAIAAIAARPRTSALVVTT